MCAFQCLLKVGPSRFILSDAPHQERGANSSSANGPMVCSGYLRLTVYSQYPHSPQISGFWSLSCRDASDDRYEFELQNQAGSAVQLGVDDRRALVTGLALHEKARRTLAQVGLLHCCGTTRAQGQAGPRAVPRGLVLPVPHMRTGLIACNTA